MTDTFFKWAVVVTPFILMIWNGFMQSQINKVRKSREDEKRQNDELVRLASSDKRLHDRVQKMDETIKALPGLDVIETLKGDLKSVNIGMSGLGKSLDTQSKLLERIAEHRERLVKLESHIEHFPDHVASQDDVQQVHGRVTDLRKVVDEVAKDVDSIGRDVAGTAATMRSINGNLDLLNQSELLQKGRKK